MNSVIFSTNKAIMKKTGVSYYGKTVNVKKAKALKASRRSRRATSCNKTYSTFINQLILASDIDKE